MEPKISNEENLVETNPILHDDQSATLNSVQEQSMISDPANQATVHINSSPVSSQVRPKLPKLVLSKFKGNVTKWTTFWDSYKTAVHENSALTPIDKFNYLNSLLEGVAARSIQGLSLTAANYDSAVEILHERFGKTQQIITCHMDELLKLPACTSERPSSLRYVYDKISVHTRGLASLGVASEQYGSLLIPIIMDKLPSEIRLQVARKATGEVWQIDELLKTIKLEVEAREASEMSKIQNSKLPTRERNYSRQDTSTSSSLFTKSTNDFKLRCVYCEGEHYSASCKSVVNAKDRKDMLRKSGRCFVCLKTNHKSKDCNSPRTCRHCNNKHHQSICEQGHVTKPLGQDPLKEHIEVQRDEVTTGCASVNSCSKNKRTVLLQTARAIACNEGNTRSIPVRVLFDNGSQRSYITDSLQSKLGLTPVKKEKLRLNTFGESRYKTQNCEAVKLQLKKPGCNNSVNITALSFPVICSPLPSRIDVNCPHLEGLELADDWSDQRGSIDLLIGSDHYWDIVQGDIIRGKNGPTAVSSSLGWLLSGPVDESVEDTSTHSNLIISRSTDTGSITADDNLVKTIEKFWETEAIGIKEPPAQEVAEFFNTNVSYTNNRYEVSLPWKEERPSDHYNLSFNRLKMLQRRLVREPELLREYDQIIKDQLQEGIIERVTEPGTNQSHNEDVHYMPHHGVVRKDKQTTKLRIVYDGSATPGKGELSINDCLQPGPNFIPKLFDVLVKFRWHPVALTADIEKAFLMIGVQEADRDMLRFLWFEDPPNLNSEISHFRFTRLVFGLRPSPAILGSTIAHHLDLHKNIHPELVKQIEDSLYVDDLVTGAEDEAKALHVYQTSKKVMAEGSFNLRKWHSNSPKLLKKLNEIEIESKFETDDSESSQLIPQAIVQEDETYTKSTIGSTSTGNEEKVMKLLGVSWNCQSDELLFNLSDLIDYVKSLPVTKRSLLRLTAKIFDPLGILSPFIIKLKILFQVMCLEKKVWDEPLQGEMLNKWNTIVSELKSLNAVRISRCYFHLDSSPVETRLHAFSDASGQAYAAVLYMRSTYKDGHVEVRLIASKSRVAPLKKQSIPRLELLGAVILSRLVNTVVKALPNKVPVTYWVDSMTVLCWIKHEKLWKQYVNHRVNEIRQLTKKDDWRFCPGTENPADLPTRGLSGAELQNNQLWWNGPEFLQSPETKWPTCPTSSSVDNSASLELVKNPPRIVHSLMNTADGSMLHVDIARVIDCHQYSNLNRLLRVTAYVLRFLRNLENRVKRRMQISTEVLTKELTATELTNSETVWVRTVQAVAFAEEIQYLNSRQRSSPPARVAQFGLFLDERGTIRCKGRINETTLHQSTKNPILLPSKHQLSDLVIRETHERTNHSGVRDTLATTREKFWILRGREAVKKYNRHCVVCRKLEGKPYRPPRIPDLPSYRVSTDPPFSHTGLDFAGPLYVRNAKGQGDSTDENTSKVYVLLMTCASTRAVHLELTQGLSVRAFLLAIRRFISRRGLPATFISDNAKTFKSASREVKKITRSEEVLRYLTNNRVTWRFIVDRAPWWGGFWERMVKTVKQSLKKAVGRTTLTYDELNTILIEVESIVNARPMTYVYDDNESVSYPLTPSHLIYGRKITSTPNSSHFEVISTNNVLTRRARHHRNLLRQLTNHWRRDYLLSLRENAITKSRIPNTPNRISIAVGDIVLLKSDSTSRNFWKLAKVEELIASRDGEIRAAVVKTVTDQGKPSRLRRVIQQLIPLEIRASEANEQRTQLQDDDGESNQESASTKVRRSAAVVGELRRRDNNL